MHIIVNRSLAAFLELYVELLRTVNIGEVKAEQQVWINAANLDGKVAMSCHNMDGTRFAWAVEEKDNKHLLVWFANHHNVIDGADGKLIPDISKCHSAFFLQSAACALALDAFMTNGHLPESATYQQVHSLTG